MTDFFDLETRKKIYRLIKKNPGLNLSTISEMLQINVSLVDYHTRYFEKHELLTIIKETGFKRYYVKGSIGVPKHKLFDLLRQETPLRIVLFLLKNPFAKYPQICTGFDISRSTLSYHLKKLVKNEIVRVHATGDDWEYVVAEEKEVIRFLLHYRPSEVLKRFKDAWDDLVLL